MTSDVTIKKAIHVSVELILYKLCQHEAIKLEIQGDT